MTAQPSLFDVSLSGRVRRTDPQTSLDAARTVSGRTVTLIHGAFLAGPTSGMTDSELCAVLPLPVRPDCHLGSVASVGPRRVGG